MGLAAKMYVAGTSQVPCVGLPSEVNLDDIAPWATSLELASELVREGKAPAMFVFVPDSTDLRRKSNTLKKLWDEGLSFWLFYPKKPHLNTDLGRDKTWEIMLQAGMKGTRQVGVDQLWSCMYFKNSAK